MKHPLVGKAIYFYLVAWAAVSAAQASVLYFFYSFSPGVAVNDALIHNILLAGLGLSYWYVVQYLKPADHQFKTLFFTHLAGIIISVSLVSFLSGFILKMIFAGEEGYLLFLNQTYFWRIIIGICFMTLVVMVYYLLKYHYNLRQKEQDELELQHLLRNSELEMLKFQVNPHFIFNSLNSISSLTHTDSEKAREMVIRLSEFLRTSLRNNPEKHTLQEELEQMNLYLEIEKVRFGDRLKILFNVEDKCHEMTIPNMILQPLYENAVKYGIYDQLGDVEVKTFCQCENGALKVSVSNDYDSASLPRKGKGIGLRNIQNRLELIYNIKGLVTIEKDRTIFTVHVLIPQ